MIPLVDLKAQYRDIKSQVDEAISGVLENTQFIQGKDVREFEEEFAQYCGTRYAIGVASGTAALHIALRACGVGAGDEVITTPFTFVATVEAITWVGAVPVMVDIDPVTYTIDPAAVEEAVTERTRAIVPVHLFGHSVDMDPLLAISESRGIKIIEDAAQAHGAEYKGMRAGSIGIAGCFSFYPSKNLGAYGDAGAITTSDSDVAARARRLREHGRENRNRFAEPGFGERLDTLQAAILRVKLRHLDSWTERRRSVASQYDKLLRNVAIQRPTEMGYARHVYHLYVLRVPNRDAVMRVMEDQGVGVAVYYPTPVHLQPAFEGLGYRRGQLPHAEQAAEEVLSIPLYPEISEEQVKTVARTLEEAVQTGRVSTGHAHSGNEDLKNGSRSA